MIENSPLIGPPGGTRNLRRPSAAYGDAFSLKNTDTVVTISA
jgi:hypothetical protein